MELMVMVIKVKILLSGSSYRHKIRTRVIVSWQRVQPSRLIVISKITTLQPSLMIVICGITSLRICINIILRRITSSTFITETIVWVQFAMALCRGQRRAAMAMAVLPDQANQPLALHGIPAQHRRMGRRRRGVRIERRGLPHAHPLVGAFPVGKIVGVRPRRSPHRRLWRRRVEGGMVLRRGRRGRRVEIVREGVRRQRRRRAKGEVGSGTDGAKVGAGAGREAPWIVHEAVAGWVWGSRVLGRRRKNGVVVPSEKVRDEVPWIPADGCACWGAWGRGEKPEIGRAHV